MIDTVVLTLMKADKLVWEPDRFTPSLRPLKDQETQKFGARMFNKYIQNIDTKYGYYPRLTVTPRWNNRTSELEIPLKIEFSAPKLLYGNNVDELEEKDFPTLITNLKNKLKEMGVMVLEGSLENAVVTAVHFGKNIPLTDHYTATSVIKELGKVELSRKLEINNRQFKNDGHALYIDCNSYQIVFYDKAKDLTKTDRQAVDKDRSLNPLPLFEYLKSNKQELFRFEVRITNKAKLKSLLSKLIYSESLSFKDIFKMKVAQKFLTYHWELIVDKNLFLLRFSDENALQEVILYQKDNGRKLSAIETLGLAQIIDHSKKFGLRSLRSSLGTLYSDRSWFRFKEKYLTQVEQIAKRNNKLGFIDDIENSIKDPAPYRARILEAQEV